MRSPHPAVPEGFRRLDLSKSLFLETNGPFYVRREGDEVLIGMRVEARHCNSMGTLHGGMMGAFADVTLTVGANILARTQRFLVTLSLGLDYVGAAKAGDWVQAPVEVVRVTRGYVFAQAVASTLEGTPVARINGTLLVRGDPDPQYDGERFFR